MIKFLNIKISQVAVHQVGNKSFDEQVNFSDKLVDISDERLVRIFLKYFLSSFSENEMYNFFNEVGIEQNEIYILIKRIFENPNDLFNQSKIIAQHLYNCSTHPKIKSGDLFIVYFNNIIIDNINTDAIGIFKAESKENYLKVDLEKNTHFVNYDDGININKLDKGCLVFKIDESFKVCIIDSLNKASEASYWKDNFLSIKPIKNEYHQTNEFLSIAKQFVTKQLDEEFKVSKADKIDYLNRSVDYFKSHAIFDKQEFEELVFEDEDLIKSFRDFDQIYCQEKEVELPNNFDISPKAVKKQARVFKSVLKLDKNFDIYIHGSRDLIEQGIDEYGRKFYKIFYEEEN